MIKWLLVVGVIVFVYYFFIKKNPPNVKKTHKKSSQSDAQDMIECSNCGVYVEIDEAILSNGKYFCSQECLKG